MTGIYSGPLRSAVIGCGGIAYEHLPFLTSSQDVELVALCDHSHAMAQAAAQHFSVSLPLFTDAAEMLQEMAPDIVHVLTPPHTHAALVRMALDAGAHVICEKPMTGTAADTQSLLKAAAAADRVLVESRNLLFNDPVIALLDLLDSGRLGQLRECEILLSLDFLSGPFGDLNLAGPGVVLPAGAVHDFLPHLVYLFQALTGIRTADTLLGELSNRSGNQRAKFDFCEAILRKDPVRGRLRIATDVEPSAFRIYLRGSLGSAETDLYNPFLRIEAEPDLGKRYPLGQIRAGLGLIGAGTRNLRNKIGQHGTTHGLPRMLAAVYAAIRAGEPVPITSEEILATALLTDQILTLGDARQ